MAFDDEKNKKIIQDEDDSQGGETGAGGVAGEIGFRFKDAMSIDPRDDALPPSEIKRLLAVHRELHKARVDKQKILRKERNALKQQGSKAQNRTGLGYGSGGGRYSPYKKHPISSKAQFSGVDRQVTGLPSENIADTNKEQRDELENRNELRNELRYQNAPKFNPKPRPY
ncbi:MAG: hypothetical protein ABI597_02465 [Gammaproteobacteria bacterium]